MQRRLNDSVTVSGQIGPGDVAALAEAGFTTIVCGRPDGEMAGQPTADSVRQAAEDAGLRFAFIPVQPGFPPSTEEAEEFRQLSEDGPIFAYCGSGPRMVLLASLAAAQAGRPVMEIAREAAEAGIDITPALPLLQSRADQDRP
ncbi:MAG: TIGR01244 family sulfur transferase [Parvularcula sp.]|jgi:uncharacterized protein (TIGR01244 family)|nr:TIGR01244 family sulfur transferase [Parvularcula sp.]